MKALYFEFLKKIWTFHSRVLFFLNFKVKVLVEKGVYIYKHNEKNTDATNPIKTRDDLV